MSQSEDKEKKALYLSSDGPKYISIDTQKKDQNAKGPSQTQKQISDWIDYLVYEIPPGPKFITYSTVINLQKCCMLPYLLILQYYYNNYSDLMCIYTIMHGSYGCLWFLKHLTFPDKRFEQKCTIMCAIVGWATILGPYCIPGLLLASGRCNSEEEFNTDVWSKKRVWISVFMYIIGVTVTMTADCQKNVILMVEKHRPLLIGNGMFSTTRNPNYLGEMILYFSFALVTNHIYSYSIMIMVFCTIFPAGMYQKELSLMQKPGYAEYAKKSNILVPKIFGMNGIVVFLIFVGAIFLQDQVSRAFYKF